MPTKKRAVSKTRQKRSTSRGSASRRKSSSSSRSKSKSSFEKRPWRTYTAMSKREREAMPENCFLDSKNRKYPICYKGSRAVSCVGLRSAERRAYTQRREDIAAESRERQQALGCFDEKGKWKRREERIFGNRKR